MNPISFNSPVGGVVPVEGGWWGSVWARVRYGFEDGLSCVDSVWNRNYSFDMRQRRLEAIERSLWEQKKEDLEQARAGVELARMRLDHAAGELFLRSRCDSGVRLARANYERALCLARQKADTLANISRPLSVRSSRSDSSWGCAQKVGYWAGRSISFPVAVLRYSPGFVGMCAATLVVGSCGTVCHAFGVVAGAGSLGLLARDRAVRDGDVLRRTFRLVREAWAVAPRAWLACNEGRQFRHVWGGRLFTALGVCVLYGVFVPVPLFGPLLCAAGSRSLESGRALLAGCRDAWGWLGKSSGALDELDIRQLNPLRPY